MSEFLNKKVSAPVAVAIIVLAAAIAVVILLVSQVRLIGEELRIPDTILMDRQGSAHIN